MTEAESRRGKYHCGTVDVERVVKVAKENPELTTKMLGIRFGVSAAYVSEVLKRAGVRVARRE